MEELDEPPVLALEDSDPEELLLSALPPEEPLLELSLDPFDEDSDDADEPAAFSRLRFLVP